MPLYTVPNPPLPTMLPSLKLLVALSSSLEVNICSCDRSENICCFSNKPPFCIKYLCLVFASFLFLTSQCVQKPRMKRSTSKANPVTAKQAQQNSKLFLLGATLIQRGMPNDWRITSITCWDMALNTYLLQVLVCPLHCNRCPPSSHRRSSLLGTCIGNYLLCWHTCACTDFWWSIHQYLANIHMETKHISELDCVCQLKFEK